MLSTGLSVPEVSHSRFRENIVNQTLSLSSLSTQWNEVLSRPNPNLPEGIIGEINVATGQSKLLIQERFAQFANLINDSEFKRGEKDITLQDLQGFWDIIFFQVENITKNFEKLDKLKKNDWMPSSASRPHKPQAVKARRPLGLHNRPVIKSRQGATGKSSIRDHILAQRRKLKLGKDEKSEEVPSLAVSRVTENTPPKPFDACRSPALSDEAPVDMKTFEAGFFEIQTPVRNGGNRPKRSCHSAKSSPVLSPLPKYLASSALKRRLLERPVTHKDYSPCMRITRSMKKLQAQIEDSTP